jgi:hypothetical protein
MWTGGLQDCNKTMLVHWPLAAGRYSVVPTYCLLMIDSYSARRLDNLVLRRACTQHGKTTGHDDLHTVEDIICYTRQVAPEYVRIQPPWGHLSGPVSHCTCRGLELLMATQTLESLG